MRHAHSPAYVHGYSDDENARLLDQANTLSHLLHHDTHFPDGSSVLEAGCGVGAQTVILARRSPGAKFTSIDISPESLSAAAARTSAEGLDNVEFARADLYAMPFSSGAFDHVFLCFVLEHLSDPHRALAEIRRVLKPGGTLTAIEGDHGSVYYHPASVKAQRTIDCLVTLQARAGGDALVGRRLAPLVTAAGFASVRVTPRVVYADASRPAWVEGFTKSTFIAMVEGVRARAIGAGLIDERSWQEGIRELAATADPEGTFNYTFFKAVALR